MKKILCLVFLLITSSSISSAKDFKPIKLIEEKTGYRPSGFLDFNTYHDTRNFRVNTLNARLNLPGPFSYFSLTNWQGDATGDNFFDYGNYITEQNLFYQLGSSAFDLNMQYFSISGDDNDALRFGVQVKAEKLPLFDRLLKKINSWYHFTYYMYQVDHLDSYAFQLQHVWYTKILPKHFDNRVYFAGFADQNFYTGSADLHNKLVAEAQLGLRVWRGLHAVSELRWNGFFPKGDRFGLGVGLQYLLVF